MTPPQKFRQTGKKTGRETSANETPPPPNLREDNCLMSGTLIQVVVGERGRRPEYGEGELSGRTGVSEEESFFI